jgi:hypothetical protein
VTTRSIGFHYHGYPYDFWRYEPEDMRAIFVDFEIVALERDTDAPGVFMLARKPAIFREREAPIALYSMVARRRRTRISDLDILLFRLRSSRRSDVRPALARAARGLRRAPRTIRRRVIWPIWRSVPAPVQTRIKGLLGRGR